MIPLQRYGTVGRVPDDDIHDPTRIRAVADKIAEEGITLRTVLTGVPKTSRQRLGVGVDVGQQGNAQRTCSGRPV